MARGANGTRWKLSATLLGVFAFVVGVVVANIGWLPDGWSEVLGIVAGHLVVIVGAVWIVPR